MMDDLQDLLDLHRALEDRGLDLQTALDRIESAPVIDGVGRLSDDEANAIEALVEVMAPEPKQIGSGGVKHEILAYLYHAETPVSVQDIDGMVDGKGRSVSAAMSILFDAGYVARRKDPRSTHGLAYLYIITPEGEGVLDELDGTVDVGWGWDTDDGGDDDGE